MANELIRPIDENTANAIEESARALGKGFDLVGGLGAYLAQTLGGAPQNLIGLLVGDWLIHKRVRRWSELQAETRRILDERNVKGPYEDISPSIALPLIEAALGEDREGLKNLWAKLLAAAMDPKRKQFVRADLISTLKQLEPLDVLIIQEAYKRQGVALPPTVREHMAQLFSVSSEEIVVSVENLERIGCLYSEAAAVLRGAGVQLNLAPRALLLLRAVR